MRKFNPETMKLEIGGGKEINVSDHAVWCAMQIPNAGGARAERDQLGLQIVGPSYNSRKGIMLKHITAGLKNRSLTGELGLRAFFMAAFQCLLFSNTDTNIRLDDVRYTQDIQNIGTRTWCKAVVDRLSVAARLYKLNYAQKGINAPISGCTIFLVVSSSQISIFFMFFVFIAFFQLCTYFCCNHIFHCCNLALAEVFFAISFCFISVLFFFRIFLQMLYVDNLQHGFQTSPFSIPWCSFLPSKMIQAILNEDRGGMSLATLLSLDISGFFCNHTFFFANVTTVFLLQLWFLQFCHFC
jgi:hypothetical protein